MEYIDIYDENQNYLGKELRKIAHEKGLWHKTVHCWLYDEDGFIYFQIRKEEEKLYTTSSGHVSAGETLQEAFGREIKEEIGIDLDYNLAKIIEVIPFKMDRINKDNTIFKDRAYANIFGYLFKSDDSFSLDKEEVIGIVKVKALNALHLLTEETGEIDGVWYDLKNNKTKKKVIFEDFLVNPGETAILKYGNVLRFVIEQTQK